MVSTYLSYNLVNRDIKASLNRTASDPVVARQTEYFKENIGKVSSLEEFLDDYQLYSYAMKASASLRKLAALADPFVTSWLT